MIHILINPAGAGGRTVRYWKKLEPLFRESGKPYEVHLSRSQEHFYEICRQICVSAEPCEPRPAAAPASAETAPAEPCDLVVVGGDGTINQALNGITDLSAVRLGFIPCGSGNDLAKDLRLAADGKEVVRSILSGKTARVSDVGIAELLDEDGRVLRPAGS